MAIYHMVNIPPACKEYLFYDILYYVRYANYRKKDEETKQKKKLIFIKGAVSREFC